MRAPFINWVLFKAFPQDLVSTLKRTRASSKGDLIDLLIVPGDVFVLRGSGQLSKIGTVQGFLGHVVLVVGSPRAIRRGTHQASELGDVWPSNSVAELWRIPTAESTRAEKGLYFVDLLVFVDKRRGNRLTLFGEISKNEVSLCKHEEIELWQSPHDLRKGLCVDLVKHVLGDMKASQRDWSRATAVRALLTSAKLRRRAKNPKDTLRKVMAAWDRKPICTSIVVTFWQRYLLKSVSDEAASAIDLILRWMPLKADRTLPGELTRGLQAAGWVPVAAIPGLHSGLDKEPS